MSKKPIFASDIEEVLQGFTTRLIAHNDKPSVRVNVRVNVSFIKDPVKPFPIINTSDHKERKGLYKNTDPCDSRVIDLLRKDLSSPFQGFPKEWLKRADNFGTTQEDITTRIESLQVGLHGAVLVGKT